MLHRIKESGGEPRWRVFQHSGTATSSRRLESLGLAQLQESAAERRRPDQVPFLLDPSGRPDDVINDFFRPPGPGAALSELGARTYAYSIATYCNLMNEIGSSWRTAEPFHFGQVREIRIHGSERHAAVTDGTWSKDFQAIRALYRWAQRFGIESPISERLPYMRSAPGGANYVRSADVKWFTRAAFSAWSNAAFHGLLPDGQESTAFRGRNSQRDGAFADVLFRTGLRVQEAGSLMNALEWPEHVASGRRFVTAKVASATAKGGRGRKFWIPASSIAEVRSYLIGERARAVAAAHAKGIYNDSRRGWLAVIGSHSGRVRWRTETGHEREAQVDALAPAIRRRLLIDVEGVREPLALWLSQDGVPFDHRRWNAVFTRANVRFELLGIAGSQIRPHHLRHSFALRWFAVGRTVWLGRTQDLDARERNRLRDEMPSEWFLVQTLLGHRSVETTRNVYLEPFAGLDVELLLAQAEDESTSELLAYFLAGDARVDVGVKRQ